MVSAPQPRYGEQFLHKQDSDLHRSLPVELEQQRRALRELARARTEHDAAYLTDVDHSDHAKDSFTSPLDATAPHHGLGSEVHTKPAEKIEDWMAVLKHIHEGHRDDPRVLERIKASYHKRYVIKPEDIPESAYQLEARIARNMGYGDISITDEYRHEKAHEIIAGQEESLDRWVDYLTSDDATYPMWLKYWAFTSVTKMGKFEKKIDEDGHESARFARRTEDTLAPFPPLNPRALALTLSALESKASQLGIPKAERQAPDNTSDRLDDSAFRQLLATESFSKIYTQFLIELPAYSAEGLRETRGRWVKYDQGSDAQPLVDSLQGHPLEWCTAGIETARSQLRSGDFYVYYSLDDNGESTIPRVAIRMGGRQIAEVRGIAPNQELDPYISEVVAEKMQEFPDGERYSQKAADMKRLTKIDERVQGGGVLSREDLRFLYEIDREIEGFGYAQDPRIAEILTQRDIRADLSLVLNIDPAHISLTTEDALRGDSLYHYGDLDLSGLTSADGLKLPDSVVGSLNLASLTSADGLKLPDSVGGYLNLHSLSSADGLHLPDSVGDSLDLHSLTSADGLQLPDSVGGDLDLASLTSADGLKLPDSVGGDLDLASLTSADGLQLPDSVGGNLYLRSLTSADGLQLPDSVGGDLDLASLTSADGLQLPDSVGGLDLSSLTSAEGLQLPDSVVGSLNLASLISADGLQLPKTVGDALDLSSLTSAEGLQLPDSVVGSLNLASLTSADGLKLPDSVGDGLYLSSLTSADGLQLPDSVGGSLDLSGLTSADGLKLPDSVGGYLNLASLTSADGLHLPDSVGDDLYLSSLTSADGLQLPDSVGGNLYLRRLTSADGLQLPDSVGGNLYLRRLTSADGLQLPDSVGGSLDLASLTSADGLHLPKTVGRDLDLVSLTSADGLLFPDIVGGDLVLSRLRIARAVTLPQTVGGGLYLNDLESAKGLRLPEKVGASVVLQSLPSEENNRLQALRPDLNII